MDNNSHKKNLNYLGGLRKQFIVFCGMPKTGTTLPVTLLDGHSAVVVYPEELRFFHMGCDRLDAAEAAERFLSDLNTRMLDSKDVYFAPDEYMTHGGTGFGRRDYSAFNFDLFSERVSGYFHIAADVRQRFLGICLAFVEALGITIRDDFIFACKAPRNELYSNLWHEVLGDEGRYVVTARRPTEHYLSRSRVAGFQRKRLSAPRFVTDVRRTCSSWAGFPRSRTLFLDYDQLIQEPERIVGRILALVGETLEEINSIPTKMGVPWSGNSSKGKVETKVYMNPHVAEQVLDSEVYGYIEHELSDLYARMAWPLKGRSTRLGRAKIKASDFGLRLKTKLASTVKKKG